MSSMLSIGISGINAAQVALATVSNNIANASTAGYSDESVDQVQAITQSNGQLTIGNGVNVVGVQRAYSQAAATQLNTSQSTLSQLTSLQNYTSHIDNLFGTTAGGCMLAGEALAAARQANGGADKPGRVAIARFFAENVAVAAPALANIVTEAADGVLEATPGIAAI